MIRRRYSAVWAAIAAVTMLAGMGSMGVTGVQTAWADDTGPIAVFHHCDLHPVLNGYVTAVGHADHCGCSGFH